MRTRVLALAAATLVLSPMAASAQYYGGGYEERGRDVHVDRYRHGDHDDVVVHRDRPRYEERPVYFERRHHHHHHHDNY
jgi:Ni/Co efflux regulator RcnB